VQIQEFGGTAISLSADVSSEAEVESMMRAVSCMAFFPHLVHV
jgi:hypothetical protein